MRNDATTGDGEELPEAFRVNGKGLPPKLFTLRQKLYLKAKREPRFRFYALYDRIYRQDVLEAAWAQVARNDGSAGVDGVTIEEIENSPGGPEALVAELHQSLKAKSYRPHAVRRVYIPKPDGRLRPLGIPTVRDRVANGGEADPGGHLRSGLQRMLVRLSSGGAARRMRWRRFRTTCARGTRPSMMRTCKPTSTRSRTTS
ncbi:MAG TPA: hypothetical protein VGB15_01040 [Longimicrobium sp.]